MLTSLTWKKLWRKLLPTARRWRRQEWTNPWKIDDEMIDDEMMCFRFRFQVWCLKLWTIPVTPWDQAKRGVGTALDCWAVATRSMLLKGSFFFSFSVLLLKLLTDQRPVILSLLLLLFYLFLFSSFPFLYIKVKICRDPTCTTALINWCLQLKIF